VLQFRVSFHDKKALRVFREFSQTTPCLHYCISGLLVELAEYRIYNPDDTHRLLLRNLLQQQKSVRNHAKMLPQTKRATNLV